MKTVDRGFTACRAEEQQALLAAYCCNHLFLGCHPKVR
jgi:hypothetical protein